MIRPLIVLIIVSGILQGLSRAYQIPAPKFLIYRKGFKVSIPNEEGMQVFAFNAHLNSPIGMNDLGTFYEIILKPDKSGRWSYRNYDAELQLGDTLNYWLFVFKNEKRYVKLNVGYTVKNYVEAITEEGHETIANHSIASVDNKTDPKENSP